MPGSGAYAFTDSGDYEASIYEAKIELVVADGSQFKAILTRAELGQLHLLRSKEDFASIAYVGLRPDLVFVVFPTRFNPPPIWGGQELRAGDMVIHGLGEHLHARTSGPSEKGFIALKPEHLAFWSKALTQEEVVPPTFARIFRPSPAAASHLRYLHASACRLVEKSPEVIAHPEVARALEQQLIHALINCLRLDAPPQTRPIGARHAAVMSRFEDALAVTRHRLLHVPEICMAIGVSERTLRLCCAEFLGMSPARYLRLRHLKLARSALLTADSAVTSVAAVARQHGFTELGRFAGVYRAVYGEAPSTTLRLPRRQRRSPE